MIQKLKNWLEARRKARLQREFDNGYKWARDSIIDGASPKDIEARLMYDGTPFERGVGHYLRQYAKGDAK